jgi:DNA invertase Pin-like site-specific DNA recombinase
MFRMVYHPDATHKRKMAIYGYARVSSSGQNLETQIEALTKADCEIIREEKRSGTKLEGRGELKTLLQFMRKGDTLVITRIDRLARSNKDFQNIYADLIKRGIKLKCTEQPILDSDGALGGLMINILAAFAQFETELRKERQMEGIKRAYDNKEVSKKTGRLKYSGREPVLDYERIRALKEAGKTPSAIARELGIARSSVYRALPKEGA